MRSVVNRNVVVLRIAVLYVYRERERERRYAGNQSDKLRVQEKQGNYRLQASVETATSTF